MSTIGNNSSNKSKENISRFSGCYGCGVCVAACPKKVIKMELVGGFYSPVVEQEGCVECGICLNVCAFNHKEICAIEEGRENTPIESFAAYVNNPQLRKRVTSGGIVYAIAKEGVAQGAKFCGVRYDIPRQRAEHYIASTAEELLPSIGSKYIQSYSAEAFSTLTLAGEQKYIVVGTPCQIDSLRRLVRSRKCEQNFLFIDFFCHGVPSYSLWKKYIKESIPHYNNIEYINFRSKKEGWHNSFKIRAVDCSGKEVLILDKGRLFYRFFFSHRCLNRACLKNCKYKHTQSSADIRVGDLWGSKYIKDEDGVSGCAIFSQKGLRSIENAHNSSTFTKENFSTIAEAQMKEMPKTPLSYGYTYRALASEKNLAYIDKIASIFEKPHSLCKTIAYYLRRLLQKAGLKR